jgi:hypothetical protein
MIARSPLKKPLASIFSRNYFTTLPGVKTLLARNIQDYPKTPPQ